ncbi:unnamed protein product [Linum trigynum]|uniref:Root meristem growth factor 8 n=1 Tax=Linum trigynum TaxID=586398 RepID=A0AAV2CVG8_9ROSI
MVTVTWACFFLSILIPSAASACHQSGDVVSPLLLPRKLRVVEEVAAAVTIQVHRNDIVGHHQVSTPDPNEPKKDHASSSISGKLYNEKKGKEESRTEDQGFFTMDYSHVKKRRPIHNKSFPTGP